MNTTHQPSPLYDSVRFAAINRALLDGTFADATAVQLAAVLSKVQRLAIAPGETATLRNELECLWLRATGIPALSLAAREDVAEQWRDKVRERVLAALDDVAREAAPCTGTLGALDADLPKLFKTIDAHADTLFRERGVGEMLIDAEIDRLTLAAAKVGA